MVEEGDGGHGLQVLLVALLAEGGAGFVLELALPDQALLAGVAAADPAPVLVGGEFFVAARAEVAALFLFFALGASVEHLQDYLCPRKHSLTLEGFLERQHLCKGLLRVRQWGDGQDFDVYVPLGESTQTPLVFVDHNIHVQMYLNRRKSSPIILNGHKIYKSAIKYFHIFFTFDRISAKFNNRPPSVLFHVC